MKCILCGKESLRPVCRDCTQKIREGAPFLIRRSFLFGDFEEDVSKALEKGLFFDDNLKPLNKMAKEALEGKKGDYALLSRFALYMHKNYSFYLRNFEIEDDYYLTLAEEFASKVRGNEGKYLKYEILKERGNLKGALKIIDSLAKKDEKYLLEKARLLVEMGEMDVAEGIYQELLKEDNVEVWRSLADALFHRGSYDGALKIYERIIELDRNDYIAYYRLALCHQSLGNLEGAIDALRKALEVNKYHIESYLLLLTLYEKMDLMEDRKKLLTRMRRLGLEPSFFGVGE